MYKLNYVITIVLLFIFNNSLRGQYDLVNMGEVADVKKIYTKNLDFVGEGNNHFYLLGGEEKNQFIFQYDTTNNLIETKELDINFNKQQIYVNGVLKTQQATYGISLITDKTKRGFKLYASHFSDGQFKEISQFYDYNLEKDQRKLRFLTPTERLSQVHPLEKISIYQSADLTKFVVIKWIKEKPNNKGFHILLSIFDEKLNLLWEDIKPIDLRHQEADIEKILLSNNGKQAFLLINYNRGQAINTRKYQVCHATSTTFEVYDYDMKIGNAAPITMAPFYQEKEEILYLMGVYFYEDKVPVLGSFNDAGGYIFVQLNLKTKLFQNLRYTAFTLEEKKKLSPIIGQRIAANQFYITEYKQLSKDNFYFLINSQNKASNQETVYAYKNLMAVFMNQTGDILNSSILFRDGTSKVFSKHYESFIWKNKVHLIYNTFATEEERNVRDVLIGHIQTNLVVLDTIGTLDFKKTLSSSKESKNYVEDVKIFTYQNKLIFGGVQRKINELSWASLKKLQFGELN